MIKNRQHLNAKYIQILYSIPKNNSETIKNRVRKKYPQIFRYLFYHRVSRKYNIGVINILIRSFTFQMQQTNTFAKSGKASLYNTVNQEYGSAWAQDGIRPEKFDIKKQTVPTYSEIVNSMNDFKKAERLIKNRVVKQKLEADGVPPEAQFTKTTQFPIKASSTIRYPQHGLNVGPPIYRTNNMNYGSEIPVNDEMPNKFYPCNSSFTKGFPGGNYKFNGLNTVKTVSQVHNGLNDF